VKRSNIAVLISGRGSNLRSIVEATQSGLIDASVRVVLSNRADATGLAYAKGAGIETRWIDPRKFPDRLHYDRAIVDALGPGRIDLVCLAGYMRLVGAPLLNAFPNRILNIHPSLLPAFRGLHAQRQALEHGVRISGATVHLVTAGLDEGPIIWQAAVPVMSGDTEETLSARILLEEHRIYPEAIRFVLNARWHLDGRQVIADGPGL
jgi:phosphoribosylglycinamide formyltransferase-1